MFASGHVAAAGAPSPEPVGAADPVCGVAAAAIATGVSGNKDPAIGEGIEALLCVCDA